MGSRLGTTERLDIRRPSGRDRAQVIDAAVRSREFHHPWVTGPTDAEAFNGWVRRQRSPRYQGFLLWTHDHEPVGIVNVSDMIMGNFRSAHMGYYAFVGHEGKGLMSEGIRWIVRYSFTALGLHRIEANIQPGNEPSRRMAEACGFRLEGFSPNYLTVDGAWRDHERWAITAEDLPDP
jgi:[ribosomal protein S5]-alanine N-acetyltransferase